MFEAAAIGLGQIFGRSFSKGGRCLRQLRLGWAKFLAKVFLREAGLRELPLSRAKILAKVFLREAGLRELPLSRAKILAELF